MKLYEALHLLNSSVSAKDIEHQHDRMTDCADPESKWVDTGKGEEFIEWLAHKLTDDEDCAESDHTPLGEA